MVLDSNPAGGTSLRNFGNSIYPALPVSFGGYTKRHQSLLFGVYASRTTLKITLRTILKLSAHSIRRTRGM